MAFISSQWVCFYLTFTNGNLFGMPLNRLAEEKVGNKLMANMVSLGAGFKDWYFAEWGNEGPRKLQGHKALNSQHAKLKIQETTKELTKFLDRPSSKNILELERAAQGRALDILNRLKQQNKSKNG